MIQKDSTDNIVAIASSTGGPRTLQRLIPLLPKGLNAPVLVVQHMPAGFTEALARRLDQLSEVTVKEAQEGDILQKGHVYFARGGRHMFVERRARGHVIHYTDEPAREGVRPCANYMYESLADSRFDLIVCAVLTGMGSDGTEGIKALSQKKKVLVLTQDEDSCIVYGMPGSIRKSGLASEEMSPEQIAQKIIKTVGVCEDGCKSISGNLPG